MTRRAFNRLALSGIPVMATASSQPWAFAAQAAAHSKPNSLVNGVQLGLQPFCYLVVNGINTVELHSSWVEPGLGKTDEDIRSAAQALSEWRKKTPLSFYKQIKAEFDAAGVAIFAYWTGVSEADKPEEIDYLFEGAKTLGAKGVTGNPGLRSAARIAGYRLAELKVAAGGPSNPAQCKTNFDKACASCHSVADMAALAKKYPAAELRVHVLKPASLYGVQSFTLAALHDDVKNAGHQKHNIFLENATQPSVNNLMACIGTLK